MFMNKNDEVEKKNSSRGTSLPQRHDDYPLE